MVLPQSLEHPGHSPHESGVVPMDRLEARRAKLQAAKDRSEALNAHPHWIQASEPKQLQHLFRILRENLKHDGFRCDSLIQLVPHRTLNVVCAFDVIRTVDERRPETLGTLTLYSASGEQEALADGSALPRVLAFSPAFPGASNQFREVLSRAVETLITTHSKNSERSDGVILLNIVVQQQPTNTLPDFSMQPKPPANGD